jgi:hypothetical protein
MCKGFDEFDGKRKTAAVQRVYKMLIARSAKANLCKG